MIAPTAQTRILIVDDEAVITDTLASIFRMHQYRVAAVYSSEQALAIAEAFAPQILLSDIVMGEMDGLELARRFLVQFPLCMVVLITGHSGYRDMVATMPEMAGVRMLDKPVNPPDLLQYIGALSG